MKIKSKRGYLKKGVIKVVSHFIKYKAIVHINRVRSESRGPLWGS